MYLSHFVIELLHKVIECLVNCVLYIVIRFVKCLGDLRNEEDLLLYVSRL